MKGSCCFSNSLCNSKKQLLDAETARYQQACDSLKALQCDYNTVLANEENLKSQVEETEGRLESLNAEADEINLHIDILQNAIKNIEATNESLFQNVQALMKDVHDRRREEPNLRWNFEACKVNLVEHHRLLEKLLTSLKNEISSSSVCCYESESRLSTLLTALTTQLEVIASKECELVANEVKLNQLQYAEVDATNKADQLKQKLTDISSLLLNAAVAEKDCHEIDRHTNIISDNINNISNEIALINNNIRSFSEKKSDIIKHFEDLPSDIKNEQQDVTSKAWEIEKMKLEMEYEKEVTSIRDKITMIQNRSREEMKKVGLREKKIASQKDRWIAMDADRSKLEAEVKKLKSVERVPARPSSQLIAASQPAVKKGIERGELLLRKPAALPPPVSSPPSPFQPAIVRKPKAVVAVSPPRVRPLHSAAAIMQPKRSTDVPRASAIQSLRANAIVEEERPWRMKLSMPAKISTMKSTTTERSSSASAFHSRNVTDIKPSSTANKLSSLPFKPKANAGDWFLEDEQFLLDRK